MSSPPFGTSAARAPGVLERAVVSRRVAGPLLVAYLLVVAWIVFWPTADTASASVLNIWALLDRVGVGGLVSPSAVEFVTNVLLFVPLSFLGATFKPQWGLSQWLQAGLAATLAIETVQALFLPGRSPQLPDVVANTMGALAGYGVRRATQPDRQSAPDQPRVRNVGKPFKMAHWTCVVGNVLGGFTVSDALVDKLRPKRLLILAAFDSAMWFIAVVIFSLVRYAEVDLVPWREVFIIAAAAAALHVVLAAAVRLHHGRAALGTFEEMLLLGAVTATAGGAVAVGNLAFGPLMSRTVPVAATFAALVLMAWGRAVYRRIHEVNDPRVRDGQTPTLVIGAGEGGRQLVGWMLGDRHALMVPVGLVDDDPLKRHLHVRGVSVLGTTDQLADAAGKTGATTVIIAIPSATADCIKELSQKARDAGLDVKVVPSANELFNAGASISDVRDINVIDLLGRHQIDTDVASIADYLSGKRVLVTGAGGSIGSELCRQIAKFTPAELIMLDRDESALHAVQLSIYGRAMLDSDDVVLADIRDTQFINHLFEDRQPQVVFHAAALKHLPMLEQYPGESIKTNVWGTLTVLEAARESGVERFVNISTDKAANPTSVLGYSKRLSETLTAAIAPEAEGTFLSVRFGNVLASRGSVLTAFAAQIAAGGPVTVTHPDVTRYFMTVQEAVQLVIQAAAIGRDGEALVLEMGEPVSIDAVAKQLIELSGKNIDIVYTGLRPGEKMHEEFLGDGEPDNRPVHPLVSHTPVPPLDPLTARELDPWAHASEVTKMLESMCQDLALGDPRMSA